MDPILTTQLPVAIVATVIPILVLGGTLVNFVLYTLFVGRYLRGRRRAGEPTARHLQPNRWWAVLFLLPTVNLLSILLLVVATRFRLIFTLPAVVIVALLLGFIGLHFAAPVAFHFDSKRMERQIGWRPSSIYYLVVVTILGPALATHYLLTRYERTSSTPSSRQSKDETTITAASDSDDRQSTRGLSFSRRDVFKLGSVAYAGYLGYQFVGRWVENQVRRFLFGSPPTFQFTPAGWPMVHFDPGRTGAKPLNDPPVGDFRLEPLRTDLGTLQEGIAAIADRTAYVLGETAVYAIDIDSGEIQWQYREENRDPSPFDEQQWASPYQVATDGDSVLVSINLGLTGLDAATGERRWRYKIGSLFRQFGFAGNTAFISSFGVTAIDTTIGVPRWAQTWNTGPEVPAAYDDGLVITGHNLSIEEGDHEWVLLAIDARTGEEVWQRRIDTGSESSARNVPVVGGHAYYGGKNLFALDAKTGSIVWERPNAITGEHARKVVTDGELLVVSSLEDISATDRGYLQAFDASTGTPRWSRELTTDSIDPVLVGEYLYVTLDTELRVYEAASGELVSKLADDAITGYFPPYVLDDAIVIKDHWGLYKILPE